jgi:hypothetical protein
MAAVTLLPNGTQAAAPIAQGSNAAYVGSGTVSGNVIRHEQFCYMEYSFTSRSDPDGSWLPASLKVTSGLEMRMNWYVDESIFPFSTSGQNGFNLRQNHVIDFSATTGGAASSMGTAGVIYTTNNGLWQRLATSADSAYHSNYTLMNIFMPTLGTAWQDEAAAAQDMVQSMVSKIVSGGLEYSVDGTAAGASLTPSDSKFELGLIGESAAT